MQTICFRRSHSLADFLLDRLLQMLRVYNCPDFSGRVGRPVRSDDLHGRLTRVDPGISRKLVSWIGCGRCTYLLFSLNLLL